MSDNSGNPSKVIKERRKVVRLPTEFVVTVKLYDGRIISGKGIDISTCGFSVYMIYTSAIQKHNSVSIQFSDEKYLHKWIATVRNVRMTSDNKMIIGFELKHMHKNFYKSRKWASVIARIKNNTKNATDMPA